MKTRARTWWVLMAALLLLLTASMSQAVELRFSPEDQNVALNADGSLSIWLDEAIEVRTIEITVQFNGGLIEPTAGGMGAAFDELSCFVWEEFTPSENEWYGFAVSMGADCFVVGPGELFKFDFTGIANGTTAIEAISVDLYSATAEVIEDVTLPSTTVVVGDGTTPVGEGAPMDRPQIWASPNPCNPMTTIEFWLPEARTATLDIYDIKGRQIRRLISGPVQGLWNSVRWNGRTDSGHSAPSGIYMYRLVTEHEQLTGRLTLAR